ncbi:MAG: UDP-N-acetylglucosamine 2-epimerase (non-hydrolyzing) [Coriobacteriia bacterium]|nr:UDP-N-acetylglucosamine 2-epimerase (non-hydrolyzing) [Coriobacteriia bacterium]
MRVLSVVGARPQFIKAAPVCRALRERHQEILVHSGQHYDPEMSDVFFEELGIPEPDVNLGVGSGSHAFQTAEIMKRLEPVIDETAPDVVLVYGDTNTTLAGCLAAVKIGVPVAHVEAGLRSFNRAMPEELNRVLVDRVADVLFCPTQQAAENLAREGITDGIAVVGDVMLDVARSVAELSDSRAVHEHGLTPGGYFLATVHRASNTDDPRALASIIEGFTRLPMPVIWPIHPRTRHAARQSGLEGSLRDASGIIVVDPVPYTTLVALLREAAAVLTDSGGIQKEAYFFGVPCVTLREETEWVETVELGWNRLVGTDPDAIADAAVHLQRPADRPPVYGDGHAAPKIVDELERRYGR